MRLTTTNRRTWNSFSTWTCVRAAQTATLVLWAASIASAQSNEALSAKTIAAIDEAVNAQIEEQNLVGLAIGVIRDGEVAYVKGYGTANRSDGAPVTTKTIFNWASNSKPIMAVAAMQLVAEGKLDLDANVRDYVPEFPEKDGVVTTRQLMCHQSGIPHYRNGKIVPLDDREIELEAQLDPIAAIHRFAGSPLIFKPGDQQEYSSHAYVLLSAVVQRAGGAPIAEQLRERIGEPCKFESFQLDVPFDDQPHWTRAYAVGLSGLKFPIPDTAHFWKHGAGGYKSNIEDFASWAAMLMTDELVGDEVKQQMWTKQKTNDGEEQGYGLGFSLSEENGMLKVSHGGSQDETKTRLVIYPKQRHGVVILCNSSPADVLKISTRIYQAISSSTR